MDSTIINCECLDELADFAGVKEQVSAITERAMAGELDFEGALKERVMMLKGLSKSAMQKCYDERVKLNEGAIEMISGLKDNGHIARLFRVVLSFSLQKFANMLAFMKIIQMNLFIQKMN